MDIEKIKKIYQLKKTKEELEAALKEINKEIAESQAETVQDMIDQGISKVDSVLNIENGIEYSISFSFKPIFSFPGSEKGHNENRNKVLSLIQEKGFDPDGKITKFENWHIPEASKNKIISSLPEEDRARLMRDGCIIVWNKPSISFREKRK